jgi:hypothetical protein
MADTWHLAQVNVGRIVAPMDDPRMAEFKAALAVINALAEASQGFVWRLKDDSGAGATSIHEFSDPRILINISVWTGIEALKHYVYRTDHGKYFARRQTWFEKPPGAYLALWWIPAGHVPTATEAKARLALIDQHGPTPEAFLFKTAFPPPGGHLS